MLNLPNTTSRLIHQKPRTIPTTGLKRVITNAKVRLILSPNIKTTNNPKNLNDENEFAAKTDLPKSFKDWSEKARTSIKENIKIEDTEAVSYFKAANPNSTSDPNENQLPIVKQALKKRKALDILTSLL